jgi:exopolysaccharide production protein ExoQ
MVRLVAATICVFCIGILFRLNREKELRTSKALWIPTIWLFLGATRNLSEWLHLSSSGTAGRYQEGNLVDQISVAGLLALGLVVLFSRGRQVRAILQSNVPILFYFLYCGMSVMWSDFPDVAFKRWLRAIGDVVMILIVLSDRNWLVAVRRVFARVGFIAIPLSVLFIRYYPEFGRAYSRGGGSSWTGVAPGKNGLGMICLVFGLASLFRFLQIYQGKNDTRRTGPMIAQFVIFVGSLYLLLKAQSATSFACFFLAGGPMVLTLLVPIARKPVFVSVMVFAVLGLTVSSLFLNMGSGMVQELGRDSTLTGRTDIWRSAFGLVQNPILGTGYESFWIGPRLDKMEMLIKQTVNQAHNGYIEVYLNLGWVGVALLAVIFITAFNCVLTSVRLMTPIASLGLAYFIAAATYNCTEAAIKMMHPLWISLILVTMAGAEGPLRAYPPPSVSLDHGEDLAGAKPVTVGASN